MDNFINNISQFHTKFKLEYKGKPRELPQDLSEFRRKFLCEEVMEYCNACDQRDLEEQLDALVDLVYVALGTAYLQGFDFSEAWKRVHTANLDKVRAPSKDASKRGSTSDVVKPPGWQKPFLGDLVE
jgi:predicted HAD superfamily Cof-like phosphohydrolase